MVGPNAAEASHMYFAEGVGHWFGGLMATHPPLPDRIRAIEPGWDGQYLQGDSGPTRGALFDPRASGLHGGSETLALDVVESRVADSPQLVGNPSELSRHTAEAVLDSTAEKLRYAAHTPFDARALIYAMLIAEDPEVRQVQLDEIAGRDDPRLIAAVEDFLPLLEGTDDLHRLTLAQAAMPALKVGSRSQAQRLLRTIAELIKADRQIALFEWVLHRVLVQELRPYFEKPSAPRWRYGTLSQVSDACAELLSALATRGNPQARSQREAFSAGAEALGLSLAFDTRPDPNLSRLSEALSRLRHLTPLAKPRVLKAAAATVLADELVTVDEGALLQGVAAALDCPLPPAIYNELTTS
jgi:hypothetical protein